MPVTEQLIRLYEDSRSPAICRGCDAPIDFFETFPKRANMPMNRGAVPRKSENDPDTRRVVAFYAASDAHWASCPAAERFGSRKR